MDNSQLVIGVDAGGTKTQAWLARLPHLAPAGPPQTVASSVLASQLQIIGRGSAGAGNLRAVGFEAATENIWLAIDAAYAAANCSGRVNATPAAAICLGVAGAGRGEEQRQLEQWCLAAAIARRARVTSDALPVLAATYGDRPLSEIAHMRGIALICGTGSMAWGCVAGGDRAANLPPPAVQEARAGGWGYLLGDEGSGYWIALQGLRAACRSVDGRGPATRLLPAMLQRLNLTEPAQLVGAIYGGRLDRRHIASLAEVVVALAEEPSQSPHDQSPDDQAADDQAADDQWPADQAADRQAREIIERAADELSQLVLAVAEQLDLGAAPLNLAGTGGVLLGSATVRRRLVQKLRQQRGDINFVSIEEPVRGAVYLAAGLAIASS